MGDSVTLVGMWVSSYVARVRIALELKGVKYDYVEEDLANKSQLLLTNNPVHKKVPVLIINGKPIAESRVILELIDETWTGAPQLLPKDPYDRAVARFWADFVDTQLLDAFRAVRDEKGEGKEAAKQKVMEKFDLLEEAMATTFGGKPFFGGETMGLMDIVLGAMGVRIKVFQEMAGVKFIDRDRTPLLYAWMERFNNQELVKKLAPDLEKMREFFHLLLGSAVH